MDWIVSATDSGVSLLAFLRKQLPEFSAKQIKKAIESNQCTLNDKTERFASTLLGKGDKVSVHLFLTPTTPLKFDSTRLLYEDDDLFLYNKPPGISSDDPKWIQMLYELPLLLVHRLDKETSGVLMFSKKKQILEKMKLLFQQHQVRKTYLAIVDGVLANSQGIIDNQLGVKRRYQGQSIWGEVRKGQGQHAITEWKCECTSKNASLVRCWPITGRTHQIRVHLSEMGHPILGDYQYGRKFQSNYRPPRILLHAEALSFPHPTTNLSLQVHSPIPNDFQQALYHFGMDK